MSIIAILVWSVGLVLVRERWVEIVSGWYSNGCGCLQSLNWSSHFLKVIILDIKPAIKLPELDILSIKSLSHKHLHISHSLYHIIHVVLWSIIRIIILITFILIKLNDRCLESVLKTIQVSFLFPLLFDFALIDVYEFEWFLLVDPILIHWFKILLNSHWLQLNFN